MGPTLSRRGLIAGGMLAAAAPAAVGAVEADDPRKSALGQIKLTATLDGSPAYWIYSGVIYAVRPGQRPLAILAISGCEAHWAQPAEGGAWILVGATLSYFRDLDRGDYLESFDNPLTGKTVRVRENFLSGGGAVYPADGSSARAFGHVKDAVIAPKGFAPADPTKALGGVRWSLLGPSVMLMTDRSWNVAVQPQLEAQTQMADRAAFFDPRVRRLPARYSASTIIPWMTWMEMGDQPGHLVWHTSGEKVFSSRDIPGDYRARAGDMLDRLTTRPTA